MDVERFIRELPNLYDHFGTFDVTPKVFDIDSIRSQWAMTNNNVAKLLNFAVSCLDPDEVYLEVGVLQGASLCGALYGNTAKAVAVDNWIDFPTNPNNESNRDVVLRRLKEAEIKDRVILFEQDYREFFSQPHDFKAGVYFYDGEHRYEGTWDGLELAIPFLADHAIIVMDDYNWSMVKDATLDWLALHDKNARLIFDLSTPLDSKAWWNGLAVVQWKA